MLDIRTPEMTYEAIAPNHGTFVVEPLDRGFGHTFGNSLRRVLLSSIEGIAVTAVRFDGVHHEFSSIPGVKEDVTDIILNLREVVFRLEGEADEIEVELLVNGPKIVTAGDIVCSADLEIVNPDFPIAELMEDGRLDIILTVARGRGYRLGEERDDSSSTIGVIPVDSNFSPIRRVRYEIGSARVGQRTDFDKLTLEVETNGAITPEQAVSDAAKVLSERLALQEFHRQPGGVRRGVDARCDDVYDVVAVDARAHPRLGHEARAMLGLSHQRGGHHLQRALLARAELLDRVDRAHSA